MGDAAVINIKIGMIQQNIDSTSEPFGIEDFVGSQFFFGLLVPVIAEADAQIVEPLQKPGADCLIFVAAEIMVSTNL